MKQAVPLESIRLTRQVRPVIPRPQTYRSRYGVGRETSPAEPALGNKGAGDAVSRMSGPRGNKYRVMVGGLLSAVLESSTFRRNARTIAARAGPGGSASAGPSGDRVRQGQRCGSSCTVTGRTRRKTAGANSGMITASAGECGDDVAEELCGGATPDALLTVTRLSLYITSLRRVFLYPDKKDQGTA